MVMIMENKFEKITNINDIKFKYAKGKSERHGLEIHPYHEIIYFLEGNVTLCLENKIIDLPKQTLLIIPKSTYHNFKFSNENNYHRVVINFFDIPEYNYILARCITNNILILQNISCNILDTIARIIDSFDNKYSSKDREILLAGCFGELLVNLNYADKERIQGNQDDNSMIGKILEFIGYNYCKNINAEIIATKFFVSKSTVEHLFKKEMNIPLGRYIAEKRLNYAYSLLLKEVPATQAAKLCGYNEYSTFYRAFKKTFSVSPVRAEIRPEK